MQLSIESESSISGNSTISSFIPIQATEQPIKIKRVASKKNIKGMEEQNKVQKTGVKRNTHNWAKAYSTVNFLIIVVLTLSLTIKVRVNKNQNILCSSA